MSYGVQHNLYTKLLEIEQLQFKQGLQFSCIERAVTVCYSVWLDEACLLVFMSWEFINLDYGHITVKAPHPVRFEKLSTVELHQY